MYLYYIDTHPMVHSIKKTVLNDFGFDLEAPSLIRVAAAATAMTGRQARFNWCFCCFLLYRSCLIRVFPYIRGYPKTDGL